MNNTEANWISSKDRLPKIGHRILYYRPEKLTKIGEMIFLERTDKQIKLFKKQNPFWAYELKKPPF